MPSPADDEPKRPATSVDDATRFAPSDGESSDDHEFELFDTETASHDGPIGILGEYLLLEQIGVGGMGRVYRAEHRTMNRHVALKVLSSNIAERPDLLEQFFSEIRAVAKLMHPNIVTAFDAGTIGDTHYLVMELVEGEVLSDRIRRAGLLTGGEATNVLEQAAKALAYAHKLGVVHRDIKPSNMMLTKEGTLKILDFGLAMLGKRSKDEAARNIFMGTPEYMSPEQVENADQVDGRSDLYSLGATLFYLLTGRPMFSGDKMQVAVAQLRQTPDALYVARRDVDLRLDAIFQKLVAKTPEGRYASADALLDALARLSLTSGPMATDPLQRGSGRLSGEHSTSVALNRSTVAKRSQIVAIDLGMLASTAAYVDANLGPQIVPQGEGNAQHLRNMLWSSGKRIKIGAEALLKRQTHPEKVIHSLQRWIGTREVGWAFGGKKTPPEVLLAGILQQLMRNAASLTDKSDSAIITVPACYDQLHRRAIRNACRIAGIHLVQLLDKPLAGALSWLDVNSRLSPVKESQHAINAKLLFVHLGGTGLETSVIHARGLEVQQLGVGGSWKLGSLRWQNRLTDHLAARLKQATGCSIRDDVLAATRLQRTVELAMERLTRSAKVEIKFDWQGTSIQTAITQESFLQIAAELIPTIQEAIALACANAKTDIGEIDHILLAGSMLRMKPIQEIVKRTVPHNVQVTTLEKSDLARGAALQTQHYSSLIRSDLLKPRAIGCSVYDFGLLASSSSSGKTKPRILLEKSSTLPVSITRTLRPSSISGSHTAAFPMLQIIESSTVGSGNWLALGKVKPDELFPERVGSAPLQLRLEIDESGILETSLLWAEGNRQVRLPHTSDPTLSDHDIDVWREWLETTLLCADS